MSRVVVIGAGVGGLAAAVRLAAGGHNVTVCEAADVIGGKLGVHTAHGFTWDTGPSIVTMPQVLNELLADVGERLDDHLDLRPVEPTARYRWPDGTEVDLHSHRVARTASLDAAVGRGAGASWERFLDVAASMWRAVEEPVLRAPSAGLSGLARLSRRVSDLRLLRPTRSLRDLARSTLDDPRLVMIADRYATFTGSDPRRTPAALATIAYIEQAFGVWHVAGGLRRIASVLADVARAHGVGIRTSAPVTRITATSRGVTGVALASGEALPADVVVAGCDAQTTYDRLLDHDAAAAASRRAARAPRSSSGLVVLLGVEGRPAHQEQHTVCFPADYDAEFDALFGPDPRPVAEPTVYVSIPPDPELAPPGAAPWFVLVNAPRTDQVAWTPARADAYADRVVGRLDTAMGADLDGRVRARVVRSPADLEREARAPGGAIYGSSSNGAAAAFLRPGNVGPVDGLFLVGGSTHPGGGLPLVMLSASSVAGLIGPA